MAWNDVNGATFKNLHKIHFTGERPSHLKLSSLFTTAHNLYANLQIAFTSVYHHPLLIAILETLQQLQPAHKHKEASEALFLFSQNKMEM